MTAPIPVDDPHDPRIADYIVLRDPHRRIAVERTEQFFVGEGVNVVRRMIAIGSDLRSVLLTPPLLEQLTDDLDGVHAPVYVAPRSVLRATWALTCIAVSWRQRTVLPILASAPSSAHRPRVRCSPSSG